jgi:glycosyltransferase involved in cell wall biosynthesis
MSDPVLQLTRSGSPRVSFCMSTYRRTGFLQRSLALIAAQTFTDFEVVISDNDPERSGEAVVRGLGDDRFRYFSNNGNLGMVSSFNKSIERATGEYIVMITDDDPVYPEMLQVLFDLQLQYPGYGLYMGGHNTFFDGLLQAKMAKARPGINSGLIDCEIGAVRRYSGPDFPLAYLINDFPTGLLWSAGIVKREVALAIGGFPDFGSPHLADNGFTLLCGARAGCVYVNTAVAHRTIHNDNYSHAASNYESIYRAPEGFHRWVLDRLPPALVTPQLREAVGTFIGRDMTVLIITIKKMLEYQGIKSPEFEAFRKRFFKLPWLRKWRRKYYVVVNFPNLFELFLALRKAIFATGKTPGA